MLNKLKCEWQWVTIFIVAQVALFAINYRNFETKFFPVVSYLTIEYPVTYEGDDTLLFVSFDKLRDCRYLGIRVTDITGERIRIDFEDVAEGDDSYPSRPTGHNIAGPWRVNTHKLEAKQVEVIHKCDPFGYTRSIMQKSNLFLEDKENVN